MGKMSSSNKSAEKQESETKPARKEKPEDLDVKKEEFVSESKKKKFGAEIDEIFAGKKRKQPEEKKVEKENGQDKEKPKSKRKIKHIRDDDEEDPFANSSARPRRKTNDGLNIYTEDELGFNKADAGGSALCPFDCDCCF